MTHCKLRAAGIAVCLVTVLSGCLDPKSMETAPVQVSTAQGVVTCQLYRRDRVLWDRAIHRPDAMSVATADQICQAEGERIASGS
jgi:hypothetical protein